MEEIVCRFNMPLPNTQEREKSDLLKKAVTMINIIIGCSEIT